MQDEDEEEEDPFELTEQKLRSHTRSVLSAPFDPFQRLWGNANNNNSRNHTAHNHSPAVDKNGVLDAHRFSASYKKQKTKHRAADALESNQANNLDGRFWNVPLVTPKKRMILEEESDDQPHHRFHVSPHQIPAQDSSPFVEFRKECERAALGRRMSSLTDENMRLEILDNNQDATEHVEKPSPENLVKK